jgi:SHS2 domain-containing protein
MYRWIDHTGELELQIEANAEEEVFRDAVEALGELLHEGSQEATDERRVAARAPDRAALLAEFLTELLFHVETEGFVPVKLDELELREDAARGTVLGFLGEPSHLIKAITYHRLRFEQADGRWCANLVLDV